MTGANRARSTIVRILNLSRKAAGHDGLETDRDRRVLLGAASAIGARGLTVVLSLATVPLALNHLGPERYGMWVTLSSVIALLGFADLGIGYGLLNSVTRSITRGALATARREISSSIALLGGVAAALGIVFAVAFSSVNWPGLLAVASPTAHSEAGTAVAALVTIYLVGLPLSVATQVRFARQEVHVVQVAAAAGNIIAFLALVIVIAFEGGVPALVLAMSVPPLLATAANAAILFRQNAPELMPASHLVDMRTALSLVRAGFLFLIIQLSMVVAFAADTLVIAQLIGPDAVAEYGVVHSLFRVPLGVVAIATTPLWPAYGEALTRSDFRWVRATLRRSIVLAIAVTVPSALLMVFLGPWIIGIWVGNSVSPSLVLLLGFGIWAVQGSVGHTIAMFLNGAHEVGAQAMAAAAMAVANIVLTVILTSEFGVAGAIWGTVVTYGLLVLVPMGIYVPGVFGRIRTRAEQPT